MLQEIEFGSAGYEMALGLRQRVLRDPLGVQWTEEERRAELLDRHFVRWDAGRVVACVVVRGLGNGGGKIRQMAVEPERQEEGLGRELLEYVEAQLRDEGVGRFELNAREHARGFYEKLGYTVVGELFLEVGIPHWKMNKVVACRE